MPTYEISFDGHKYRVKSPRELSADDLKRTASYYVSKENNLKGDPFGDPASEKDAITSSGSGIRSQKTMPAPAKVSGNRKKPSAPIRAAEASSSTFDKRFQALFPHMPATMTPQEKYETDIKYNNRKFTPEERRTIKEARSKGLIKDSQAVEDETNRRITEAIAKNKPAVSAPRKPDAIRAVQEPAPSRVEKILNPINTALGLPKGVVNVAKVEAERGLNKLPLWGTKTPQSPGEKAFNQQFDAQSMGQKILQAAGQPTAHYGHPERAAAQSAGLQKQFHGLPGAVVPMAGEMATDPLTWLLAGANSLKIPGKVRAVVDAGFAAQQAAPLVLHPEKIKEDPYGSAMAVLFAGLAAKGAHEGLKAESKGHTSPPRMTSEKLDALESEELAKRGVKPAPEAKPAPKVSGNRKKAVPPVTPEARKALGLPEAKPEAKPAPAPEVKAEAKPTPKPRKKPAPKPKEEVTAESRTSAAPVAPAKKTNAPSRVNIAQGFAVIKTDEGEVRVALPENAKERTAAIRELQSKYDAPQSKQKEEANAEANPAPTPEGGTPGVDPSIDFQAAFKGAGQAIGDNLRKAQIESLEKHNRLPSGEDGTIKSQVWDKVLKAGIDKNPEVRKAFYDAINASSLETAAQGKAFLQSARKIAKGESVAESKPSDRPVLPGRQRNANSCRKRRTACGSQ